MNNIIELIAFLVLISATAVRSQSEY
jgi:hypothetical protein